MADINMKQLLGEPAMESFCDMRNDQPPKDRLHYFDVVLEGSTETNAALIQKLYVDIISRTNIDFGTIPDSHGALTKYKGYKLMAESMDNINKLYEGVISEEVTMMNKLHDMIIACRADYEFGYKFDIEIIKITYCVAVMTLYELINICILAYTRQMRKNGKIEFDFVKVKKKDVIVIRGAKALLKSYESGQWTRMVQESKKDPSLMKMAPAPATEASFFGTKTLGGAVSAGAAMLSKVPTPIAVIGIGLVAFVAVLIAVRALVYFFYHNASKFNDYIRTQKDFVDAAVKTEVSEGESSEVIDRHSKIAGKLEGIANFIEVRILKTNTEAKKDLSETNATNYSKSEFQQSVGFGGNIEFVGF